MKINVNGKVVSQETKEKILEVLKKEDKEQAIVEAMELMAVSLNENLINEIILEAKDADANKDLKSRLGLRTLSKEENEFYDLLKSKQAITADQIDIIPTSIVDNTMNEVKKKSNILSLVRFAPANVKKWLSASKTGTYSWTSLTDSLGETLSATITSLNIELGKLSVVLVIPKAIRDLSNEYVDKYLTAILEETFNDGFEYGFIQGTGVDMPIGIMKEVDKNSTIEGHTTEKADKKLVVCTGFSPKALAPARKVLAHGGLRIVPELHLLCNPLDRIEYVDPALLKCNDAGVYVQVSPIKIVIHECINVPEGKGIFTIPDAYDMGYSGLQVKEYTETKALDDADLIVAKAYANGRAVDNDTAVVFDITKLAALA